MSERTAKCHPLQPITDAATRGRFISPPGVELPPGHLALNALEQLARRARLLSAACESEQTKPEDVVAELLDLAAMADGVGEACEGMVCLDRAS